METHLTEAKIYPQLELESRLNIETTLIIVPCRHTTLNQIEPVLIQRNDVESALIQPCVLDGLFQYCVYENKKLAAL